MTIFLYLALIMAGPPLMMVGIIAILWWKWGWKAGLTGLTVIIGGAFWFFSYYHFGSDEALTRQAVQDNTPSICQRLLKELFMPTTDPGRDCLYRVAIANKNLTACDLAGASAWDCYTEVAAKSGNSEICTTISDTSFRDVCLNSVALATGDSGLCESIDPVYEDLRTKCRINAKSRTFINK